MCIREPRARVNVRLPVDETLGPSGDLASPTEDADLRSGFGDALRQLAATPNPAAFLPRGTIVGGHFRVERRLGIGGMGVVHLARDTDLERDVALKVHIDPTRPGALERLQQEARTMAKLAHPNVLVVHEIGTFDGRLWVAMEYVDGGTAREWLSEQPRSWTEILDLYRAAAEGLAAAHAVGIVHRDFKPENVLVGRDGRVRVADFGLARSFGERDPGASSSDSEHGTGMAGTPAFMAPEQFRPGEAIGPAADQWALCVALWHALYRAWPFETRAAWALLPGDVPTTPTRSTGPARLRRVLRQGLSVDPQARHPDMRALCHALTDVRTRGPRRRRAFAIGSAVTLAASAGIGLGMKTRDDPCGTADPRPSVLWSPARQEVLATAFESASPLGAETWPLASARLDAYLVRWQDERSRACRASSRDRLAPATACLDRALARVDGLLRAWERATPGIVEHAITHLVDLDDPTLCHMTTSSVVFDPDAQQALSEARARLAEAATRLREGPFEGADESVAAALASADAWADEVLRAQALAVRASQRARAGELEASIEALRDAYWAARRVDDAPTAVQVAGVLAWTLALELGRVEQGLEWSRHARIEVERGIVSPHYDGALDSFEGIVRAHMGRYEEAVALHRTAVEKLRRLGRPFEAARAEIALADALDRAGRAQEALEHYRSAIEVLRQEIGPGHPDVADALTNMGLALGTMGRLEDAVRAHTEAMEILERTAGSAHPDLFAPRLNLGIALAALDRFDEAAAVLDGAHEIARRTRPDEHQDFALVLAASGWLERRRGRPDAALAHFERALDHNRAGLPSDHPEIAVNLAQIAGALQASGDLQAAVLRYRAAIEQWDRAGAAEHPRSATAWVGLAEVELALGDADEAHSAALRVLQLAEGGDVEAELVARAREVMTRTRAAP
jgi:eukaryotic-like serine/threonine-protein kinase